MSRGTVENTVGAAWHTIGLAGTYSLSEQCSVFSAEAYAIKMAVSIPNVAREMLVFTDPASCYQAMEAGKSKHPWIQDVERVARMKPVQICLIPVSGNCELTE